MKTNKQIKLLFLTLVIFVSINSEEISTKRHSLDVAANQRTDTLYERCPIQRKPFFDMQRNDSQSSGRQQTASQVGLDGDQLIYNYLTKNETGSNEEINKSKGRIIVYFIFLAIGLALMIILTPIFIFCLCKPEKCPPCTKFRQQEGKPYTQWQKKWPAIVLIVLAFVVIGTMIAVLVVNPNLQSSISETRCSTSIFFDDLLNGNYTKNQQNYFMGLKPFKLKVKTMKSQVAGLLGDAQTVSKGVEILNKLIQQSKKTKHQVTNTLPQNGQQSHMDITSPQLISNQDDSNNQISSNAESSFESLSERQHLLVSLTDVSALIDKFLPTLSQTADNTIQKYAEMVNTVENLNEKTDVKLGEIQKNYVSPISIIIYIVAALSIVLAIVLLIATVFICFYQRFSCRKIVYGACGGLTFLGIICFILTLLFSGSTVASHYGCHYIEGGLQTRQEFVYRFEPVFDNRPLTQVLAECASKQGDGFLLKKFLGQDIYESMKDSHLLGNNLDFLKSDHILSLVSNEKESFMDSVQENSSQFNFEQSSHLQSDKISQLADKKFTQISESIANNLNEQYDNRLNHFQNSLQQIKDENSLTQINCKVLGQDINLITNTFCTKVFNYSFSMRVLMIISAVCLFGIMIIGTLFAIRIYRESQISKDGNGYEYFNKQSY